MVISVGAIIPSLYRRLVESGKEALIDSGLEAAGALAVAAAKESYYILILVMSYFFCCMGTKT
jgi:hypothetical protein